MDLKLLVVQGNPEGKEIPVQVSRFLIGRSNDCHLRPSSELISRHHCQIAVNGDQVTIMDLGSSNGTIVNGERISEEVPINDGDMIQVGPLGFQVLLQRDAVVVGVPTAVPSAAKATTGPEKLGSREARADDIEQWLVADSKHPVPESGSAVYDGDTQMLNIHALEDTTSDKGSADSPTPSPDKPPAELPGQEVQLADGRKVKVGSNKQVMDKTREDTSRAASDILRRIMERRPKRS